MIEKTKLIKELERVKRSVEKLEHLISEIESEKNKKKKSFTFNTGKLNSFYDMASTCERWMTCAEICAEIGEPATKLNLRSLGRYLSSLDIHYRRSNSKNMWLMPKLITF